jgi:hypothetical protein
MASAPPSESPARANSNCASSLWRSATAASPTARIRPVAAGRTSNSRRVLSQVSRAVIAAPASGTSATRPSWTTRTWLARSASGTQVRDPQAPDPASDAVITSPAIARSSRSWRSARPSAAHSASITSIWAMAGPGASVRPSSTWITPVASRPRPSPPSASGVAIISAPMSVMTPQLASGSGTRPPAPKALRVASCSSARTMLMPRLPPASSSWARGACPAGVRR